MLEKISDAIKAQQHMNELDRAIQRANHNRAAFIESYNETMKLLYESLENENIVEETIVRVHDDSAWIISSDFWDDHHHAPVFISEARIVQEDKT